MLHELMPLLSDGLVWVLLYAAGMWLVLYLLFMFGWAKPIMVICAPILPFIFFGLGVINSIDYVKRLRILYISRWLVMNLRREGIIVRGKFGVISPYPGEEIAAHGEWLGRCQVYADVAPGQERGYSEVYARVIQKFATGFVTADHICAEALPKAPLDEEWAQRHGFVKHYSRVSDDRHSV